jgi:hypothetical protein
MDKVSIIKKKRIQTYNTNPVKGKRKQMYAIPKPPTPPSFQKLGIIGLIISVYFITKKKVI